MPFILRFKDTPLLRLTSIPGPEASDSLEILVSTEKNEVFVSVAKFLGLDIPALVVIVEGRHEASD